MMLSWKDPSGFRQRSDVIQFMILRLLWLQSACGRWVGGAERRRADKLEATAAQAGDGGTQAKGMAEELERNG